MNLMNYLLACGMVMDDNGEWDVSTYLHIIIIGWITAKKKDPIPIPVSHIPAGDLLLL
jgi:hypothetical protein